MRARDLALPAQPPFCCFSHRCFFHFLSWQFRLGVEARVVPSTQGFPSCAKSGLGGQALPHLGGPKGHMPHWGQSLHQGTMPALERGSWLQHPPQHTHTSELLGQKSPSSASQPCLGRVSLLLPLPSVACQAPLTRDTTHSHTHTEAHAHTHTWSHTHRHTETPPPSETRPHTSMCPFTHKGTGTERDS